MSNIRQQLDYMYGLERFGMRLGLDVIEELMAALGNPHQQFQSVHIGGTNGKGSTAAMVASVLKEIGHKVGLYTSPHLVRFNERIQINGQEISNAELVNLVEEVRTAAEKHDIHPTFFEFTTALAFLYFAREKVDIAVVEVGLGGDLDATNVVHPEVAVITNIGYDHTEVLGNDTKDIALHKAGIIKKNSVVVTGEENPALIAYFEKAAAEQGAKLVCAQAAIKIQRLRAALDGQEFEASGEIRGTFRLPLLGEHQLQNAGMALTVLHELTSRGFPIDLAAMQRGLAATQWPGRLQILSREPLIIVDGAHNEEGAQALAKFLEEEPARQPYHISICGRSFEAKAFILAMKGDKHMPTMLEKIVPRFERVIVTEGNYEPMAAEELARAVKKYHANVKVIPKPSEAVRLGRTNLQRDDLMLITGSLYMIGEALTALARSSIRK